MKYSLDIRDDGLTVRDDCCWCCGSKKELTYHHAINRHLDPLFNVQVPLCAKCHKKHNSLDILGLKNFAHKISAGVKKLTSQNKALNSLLGNREKILEIKHGDKK